MIRYVDTEHVLRSMSDELPGIVSMSYRSEHDYGAFVIDTKWEPPKAVPRGIEEHRPEDDPDQAVPPDGEPVPWLTAISAEDVVEQLEGPKEVVFLLHMVKVSLHTAVDVAFSRSSYKIVTGLARLGDEVVVAVRMRWPHGFPA